uniref:SET domain-containing protein n=1 Tax=Elaeophora elaphi TaxID=1147741 RepID=A0A0R3RN83_9BILA
KSFITLIITTECQRLAWKKHHRAECQRLEAVFPNLPLSEVLFLSRIIDKVLFLEQNGDKYGWEKDRKWADLMDHQMDIRNDEFVYAHFEKIYGKMATFRKDEMIEKEKFYKIFCKTAINSHSVHTNAGDEIGLALDLGVSAYDHSCRPNCSLVFDGFHAYLRPLTSETNASDTLTARISYIDIGRSRYQRQKELKSKWYFDCQCERCVDPSDAILTSIRCINETCDEALIITEDSEPANIMCPKCKQITDEEHVKKCQELMLSLPVRFGVGSKADDEKKRKLQIQEKLTEAMKYLHDKNVYVTRLKAALLHVTGTLKDNLLFIQESVYENYRL